ncbi:hypothetical protein OIU79_020881 [Salix purpurea]|uniref:Uncharacterized protein n=1 Tax=Salix purpurea TaxID=77065 RepID=A0A9Q0WMS9_SALPP|nr:hypothetical protein OIU79_020881 [Salix purpurea]
MTRHNPRSRWTEWSPLRPTQLVVPVAGTSKQNTTSFQHVSQEHQPKQPSLVSQTSPKAKAKAKAIATSSLSYLYNIPSSPLTSKLRNLTPSSPLVVRKSQILFQQKQSGLCPSLVRELGLKTQGRRVVDITAIHGVTRPLTHVRSVRREGCLIESSNPSPHGGRGALPSEGGSPSDLLFLAGGGFFFF